jgi:deoxycytidine triphosphate deaminase
VSFLAQSHIQRAWFSDFDEKCLQQASYDLRLGAEVYVVGSETPVVLDSDDPYLVLKPGQFAMLTTFEKVVMPTDHIAFISVRMGYKNQGLVNISGFHVDPTFSGHLKFAVQNVGPNDIYLRYCEPTFCIFFAKLEGIISKKRDPAGNPIAIGDLQLLGGSSITLAQIKRELDQVRQMMLIYAPFAVSAFFALLLMLYRMFTGAKGP